MSRFFSLNPKPKPKPKKGKRLSQKMYLQNKILNKYHLYSIFC